MNSSQATGSRAEFITEDYPNIKYGRGGGCFVSHAKGALLLLLTAAAAAAATALLVYYLAPCPRGEYVTSLFLGEQEGSASTEFVVTETEGPGRRLPPGIYPIRYRLCLFTFFGENFTFMGKVLIDVFVASDAGDLHSITLHAGPNLNITKEGATVRKTSHEQQNIDEDCKMEESRETAGEVVPIKDHVYSKASEFHSFHLGGGGLVAGSNYTLSIPFEGTVKDNLLGFYRSSFKDSDTGEKRWVAVTQFEPTHARDAFPCFDEPALKASFVVSLARPRSGFTLSNMRIRTSEPVSDVQRDWVWDHYEPSPPMSTYLLAFLVSPDKTSMQKTSFPKMRNATENSGTYIGGNISISIWNRPGYSNASGYALRLGMEVLDYYETYFGVEYPITKMEMVAVPDFGAGAMENWGIVTYRESVLLYDPEKDSTSHKVEVALTVAHELAHQWFGNLVTMRWWKDLWLNEGFATYVEYIGTDHVEPEWGMLDRFVTEELQVAMSSDSLRSTHAVSPGNSTTADIAVIAQLFDSVSYGKGSCLVRMLNHTLGEDTFRRGLNKYLKKWSYANAEQDDLWEALTAEAMRKGNESNSLPNGLSVKDIMDTWTLQDGFPVVTVTRNYEDGSARISQERFLLEPRVKRGEEEDAHPPPKEKWHIPVTFTSATEKAFENTDPRIWLLSGEGESELPKGSLPGANEWVVFNVQQTGFYRVNYDEQNWRLLSETLLGDGIAKTATKEAGHQLPDVTKAQLIDDAFSLARGGRLNYSTALGVTPYLVREKGLVPWTAALESLRFLDDVLVYTRHYGLFQSYVLNLLDPIFTSLYEKKNVSSVNQKLLRSSITKWACNLGKEACVSRSRNLFKQWMRSPKPGNNNAIPVDDRATVYCTAIKNGGKEEWEFLWERFAASEGDTSAPEVMLPALACTREPWILNKLIKDALESEAEKRVIRLQDIYLVLRSISNNPVATSIFFQYIKNNWDELHRRYGGSEILLGELVKAGISGLNSCKDLEEVMNFRKRNARKFRFATQDLDQAEEGLKNRVLWLERNLEEVSSWLKDKSVSGTTT